MCIGTECNVFLLFVLYGIYPESGQIYDILYQLQLQPFNGLSGRKHQRVLGLPDFTGHQVQGVHHLVPGVGDDRVAVVVGHNDWWSLLSLIY